MLEKILFWGVLVSFSVAVLCFLIITIMAIIYGYPGWITDNPDDPEIEKGNAIYMEKAKYEKYRSFIREIHLTGGFSMLITFALYGLRWYITKHGSS